MASSGWQGRQDLYTVNAWLKYRGDINIQGITRSGTSLRVWGQLALCCVAGSSGGGGSQTVNYGIQAAVNGSGGKVKTSISASSYAKTFNEGTNYVIGFDTTFTNVSESASTYTVTATFKSCYNDACSSTYWSKSLNWTLTLPTNPTGLYANNLSSTYNSVSGTVGVSSYGGGSSTTLEMLVLEQSYVAGLPHRYSLTNSGALTYTTTVNNSSSCAAAGCITIKGAGLYYVGVFADNGDTQSRLAAGSIYTPPSPLQSITYTQTQNSTNVTVNLTITGGTSSDNNSNTVTTYYRYSTNGGSSYSGWTSAGTGTTWTAKTASFTCPYNASIVVQAKQTYQSKDSTTKQISFTSTSGTAPSSLTSSITASTWNSVTMSGSCNYGNPSSISGRAFTVGVNINGTGLSDRREKNTQNVSSVSGVVINNTSSLFGTFNLKGMLPVYPYAWASNTIQSASSIGSVYYLPPAPGSLTYTTTTSGTDIICALNYVGVAANNDTSYTAADLTRTVRYKGDQDANWTYVENDTQVALTTATTASVTIAATHNVTVEAWMTYKGKNSEVSTITVTNSNDPVMLYGSVNGRSKKITKLYGSVGGESVKIEKLYASVGGVSRLIYVDNS